MYFSTAGTFVQLNSTKRILKACHTSSSKTTQAGRDSGVRPAKIDSVAKDQLRRADFWNM
ncbi:hypothetical protein RO3G_01437 [Rhizopus delemar RA 99-880]|uniref:Uncharacterized protein n=1 Tax=Rhizopus delemar (strain RA 99-880 / ATCC MYA-4621 / FGSC 9543 / NRRL 43880) TaxID=246409 RepID=I1BKK3_RHIO9|nr:hypothetical protein RO3G_01437 [Rhizopus delemar RA 99-880]|eukprot:EIE76733.1 hypothetical protein RO3G_01437 [Rhizopus delemar RA 99-880]